MNCPTHKKHFFSGHGRHNLPTSPPIHGHQTQLKVYFRGSRFDPIGATGVSSFDEYVFDTDQVLRSAGALIAS